MILKKPHIIFLFIAVLIILICVFRPNSFIDIQIYDTYFVINLWHYGFAIVVLFLFFHLLHDLAQKSNINSIVTNSHIIATSIYILFFSFYHIFSVFLQGYSYFSIGKYFTIFTLIFLLVQVIFLVTIIFSMLKK